MTTVIETDETGRLVLPPELLGEVKPYSRYMVEMVGTKTIVEPVQPPDEEELFSQEKLTPDEWMQEWRELAEEIGKVWPTDKTAAEVVSEMRR